MKREEKTETRKRRNSSFIEWREERKNERKKIAESKLIIHDDTGYALTGGMNERPEKRLELS